MRSRCQQGAHYWPCHGRSQKQSCTEYCTDRNPAPLCWTTSHPTEAEARAPGGKTGGGVIFPGSSLAPGSGWKRIDTVATIRVQRVRSGGTKGQYVRSCKSSYEEPLGQAAGRRYEPMVVGWWLVNVAVQMISHQATMRRKRRRRDKAMSSVLLVATCG